MVVVVGIGDLWGMNQAVAPAHSKILWLSPAVAHLDCLSMVLASCFYCEE